MVLWQNVEKSCTFLKIHGIGKVKLQTKWPGRLIKNKENSRKSEVNDKQQNTTLSEQF